MVMPVTSTVRGKHCNTHYVFGSRVQLEIARVINARDLVHKQLGISPRWNFTNSLNIKMSFILAPGVIRFLGNGLNEGKQVQ